MTLAYRATTFTMVYQVVERLSNGIPFRLRLFAGREQFSLPGISAVGRQRT